MTPVKQAVVALFGLCMLAGTLSTTSAAPSAELVQVSPTAFSTQKPLLGYLTRPHGKGPFPAVVVLHGCAGFGPRETAWAQKLASWGYAALAIDSFTPRNLTTCSGLAASGGSVDAYLALQYLAQQPFIAPGQIAVLGSSLGGVAALGDVEPNSYEQIYHVKFRGAVAYYPTCTGDNGMVEVPTLVIMGERDDWAWPQACRDMVARAVKQGAPLHLTVYPNATHDFDVPAAAPYLIEGHHMAYDPDATRDAEQQVRDFLHSLTPGEPAGSK
jgi:dienelactone hydrolase